MSAFYSRVNRHISSQNSLEVQAARSFIVLVRLVLEVDNVKELVSKEKSEKNFLNSLNAICRCQMMS